MEKSYLDNDDYGITDSEYSESKAKKVCIASLVFRYAVPLVVFFATTMIVLSRLNSDTSITDTTAIGLVPVAVIMMFVSYIISWILMAKVRLRRREYRFGKLLMWLYIADTVLAIFGMILQLILYFVKSGLL
ncbi:MAG: hypothetical protein IKE92_02985 [Clostridiales bacterium]|nr:hypothetical protein [Clostridiales bacterium]